MKKGIEKQAIKTDKNSDSKKSNTSTFSTIEDSKNGIKYFSIFGIATILYLIAAKLLLNVYNPDTNKAIAYAKSALCVGGYAPEPMEKTLYFLGVFIFIASFFILIFLFNRLKITISNKTLTYQFWIIQGLSIVAIIFLGVKCFSIQNPYFENIQNSQDLMKSNWDFYTSNTFIHENLTTFTFIIFPILLFLFFRGHTNNNKSIEKISTYSTYLFCGLIIAIIFFITAFSFPYTFENKYDLNAIYYSVIQVFHGAPMLVDGFTNTYGLYPHFVMPILKIFGLSIHSFTIIMAILLCLCFVFLLKVLNQFIDNKWLVLFGFCSVFFNSYMFFRIATPYDNAFSMHPIRWIPLFSLLFYASIYLNHKIKTLYYSSFAIFALCILWNPESGIISFLSLIAFYCFLDLNQESFIKTLVSWLKNILTAISVLIITFLGYIVVIKGTYGNYPDLLKMFSTIQVFSSIGIGMLPMPKSFHPYILILIIYILGLLFSINNILTKQINNKTAFLFLVTCLGVLFFPYYIGRSHNWNLFACSPMVFILLTIFADTILHKIKENKTLIPIFGILLFCISFSFFQTVYDYKKIIELVSENDNKTSNRLDNDNIKYNAEYIKEKTQKGEKILILSAVHKQGLYHELSKTASAFNPGFMELFFKTDYDRLLLTMQQKNLKIFFEPNYFRFTDLQIFPILASDYQFIESKGNFYYFEKRKEEKKELPILTSEKNDILHIIPNNNLKEKVAYAQGKKGGISLDKQFTVEVIIKPKNIPQSVYTQSATVFSNTINNTGMILRQNDTIQNAYIFGFSNHGIICKAEMGKWNYFVFEVDNATITGIINGGLVGTVPTETAYQNTKTPFYLGNQCLNPGFYFGDIREIRISKGKPDNKQVSETWEKIKRLE